MTRHRSAEFSTCKYAATLLITSASAEKWSLSCATPDQIFVSGHHPPVKRRRVSQGLAGEHPMR